MSAPSLISEPTSLSWISDGARCCRARSTRTTTRSSHCCAASATTCPFSSGATRRSIVSRRASAARACIPARSSPSPRWRSRASPPSATSSISTTAATTTRARSSPPPRHWACAWCWFAHEERALLAERGAALAYNPNSNMFLGDGVTDVVDLVGRGVRVGLGTDGGCSNSRVSVFDEMRACALLQKVARALAGAPDAGQAIDAETCFRLGTAGGGAVLGLPVGRLQPGQRADLVFADLDDPSLWPEQSLAKNVV